MTPWKEANKTPINDPKEMEICELSDIQNNPLKVIQWTTRKQR